MANKVYQSDDPSNSLDFGDAIWDEFLPFVTLDSETFVEENKDLEELEHENGIDLSDLLDAIPEEDDKVYTIVNPHKELKIPFLVKKGRSQPFIDDDGIITVTPTTEVEKIKLKETEFNTKYGKTIELEITNEDPLLEEEVEFAFSADDDPGDPVTEGEAKDVLCGRIKIKFEKKKVAYETLKIKVLDCRSNEPVRDARVNKIVLKGAYDITTDFNSEEFNEDMGEASSGNKIKQSQQALEGLGFDTNGPGTAYGDNGRSAYNAYCESRFPELVQDSIIEKVEEGNPPDEMLDYIIEEYNNNYTTDSNGLLNLKIPRYLLDAATTLELGFIHPVILEATHKNVKDNDDVIARENDATGNGTGYQITWGDGSGGNVNQ
ncbi:MAG: hypothetical protein MI922_03260, partial [Bacteroidales bacterium]|nr:hypothetical protein [Bacteroidales bacterium]